MDYVVDSHVQKLELLADKKMKRHNTSSVTQRLSMNRTKFFPYAKQSIDASDLQAVQEALLQDRITRGEKTRLFEESIAEFVGAKWAVSFNSATTALYATFFAAKATSADRFITTCNTFIATPAAGMRLHIRPHLVDIDRKSGNLSLEQLKKEFTQPPSRGKFIILPVHFAGIAVDMKKLERMVATPEVVIIEDAAHALGSLYPSGEKVGSCTYSHMTVFSFHPAKHITTGEGGIVTTNDEALYHRLCLFRNNGIERKEPFLTQQEAPGYYEIHELGGNYHMTEMQAALGLSQMRRLPSFIEKRRALVSRYYKNLEGKAHIRLFSNEQAAHTAYHLMNVQIDFAKLKISRVDLMEKLKAAGIGSEVHYIPIYRLQVFEKAYGERAENYPEMEGYYSEALSLPLYPDLAEEDVDYVCATLLSMLS